MNRIRDFWRARPSLSVELENKGSVARDHLADERTFLAWLRTSLSLVSLGVAIAQLFKLPELSEDDPEEDNGSNLVKFLGSTGLDSYMQSSNTSTSSHLESLEKLGKPLGATCIAVGAVCLLMGAYRFYLVQSHLIRGTFPPSRIEISVMSLSVGALIVAAFGVIVGVNLSS